MQVVYKNVVLDVNGGVYEPQEDSFLLAKALENEMDGRKVTSLLDMGCGSGLLSVLAAQKTRVTSVDINPEAVETTKRNAELNGVKVKAHVADLFRGVRGKYDIIVFNAPYLPDKDAVNGSEVWSNNGTIGKFISQSRLYLYKKGTLLMLVSSLTDENALELLQAKGFQAEIIDRLKIPWEELLVVRAKLL